MDDPLSINALPANNKIKSNIRQERGGDDEGGEKNILTSQCVWTGLVQKGTIYDPDLNN